MNFIRQESVNHQGLRYIFWCNRIKPFLFQNPSLAHLSANRMGWKKLHVCRGRHLGVPCELDGNPRHTGGGADTTRRDGAPGQAFCQCLGTLGTFAEFHFILSWVFYNFFFKPLFKKNFLFCIEILTINNLFCIRILTSQLTML